MKKCIPALHLILLILLSFISSKEIAAQIKNDWREISTVEELCEAYPDRMKAMLNEFNLENEGLVKVKNAVKINNISLACTELLNYYKNGTTAEYLRMEQLPSSHKSTFLGDSIIRRVWRHNDRRRPFAAFG